MRHATYQSAMSHVNESCHISMSHVAYQRVMPHVNESCGRSMSHATCQWVMWQVNESCHTCMILITCHCIMPHINESCHISIGHVPSQRVMSHRMRFLGHRTCSWEYVMSRPQPTKTCRMSMSDTQDVNESCHVPARHVTQKRVCVRYQWVMWHSNESYCIAGGSCFISQDDAKCVRGVSRTQKAPHCMWNVTYQWAMSHMCVVYHFWTRHVPYLCDTSRINKACHAWTWYIIYQRGMSRMYVACNIWMRHITYEHLYDVSARWVAHGVQPTSPI